MQEIRLTQKIIYTVEAVAEVVYVLSKVYEVSRKDISDAILRFLKARNIVCHNYDIAQKALQLFAENNLDFVDNILLAYHQLHGITIYSYDKKLMNAVNRSD